jgi:hypothetical protein
MLTRQMLASTICAIGLALLTGACGSRPAPEGTTFSLRLNTNRISRFDLLEISFKHDGPYRNRFFDVTLTVEFRSPDGSVHRRSGFFYGGNTWMVRFRPDRPGRWSYRSVFHSRTGFHREEAGEFDCVPSNLDGSVVQDPANVYRWVFTTGGRFFPLGFQNCVYVNQAGGIEFPIDGEGRSGPVRTLSPDEYFRVYGEAGFNLLRFSQKNCSYWLSEDLDRYSERESRLTDLLLSTARAHGFRVMFGIFGYHGGAHDGSLRGRILQKIQFSLGVVEEAIDDPNDIEVLEKERRFIDYCVARWGAYSDFWELLNERHAHEGWTRSTAAYLRAVDPEHRPVATSWQKPELPEIGINTPHWYESERESESDLRVRQQAEQWKAFRKPVLVGEHGNTGMNWDPKSAERMRVRLWTALFQEIALVLWNTSWSKYGIFQGRYRPGAAANIYLGPQERGYTRILSQFSSRLGDGLEMVPVETSAPDRVRAYALASGRQAAVYLHRFADRTAAVSDLRIRLPGPSAKLSGEWLDPATGRTIAAVTLDGTGEPIPVPPFRADLALLAVSAPRS